MIADKSELLGLLTSLMQSTITKVGETASNASIDQALRELHITLPVDNVDQEYWVIERSKRWLLYALLVEAASKFQYKKIFLQHRYKQYFDLVKMADQEFLSTLENDPTLFDIGGNTALFSYIEAGFIYDFTGEDITYLV